MQVPGDGAPSLHTPIGTWLRHASLDQVFAGLPAGQYMLKNSVLHRLVGGGPIPHTKAILPC